MRTEPSLKGPATLDLRIFEFGEDTARLRAAFGSQVARATLPEDIPSMAAVVNEAKDALSKVREDAHIPTLTKLWEAERERLEARWEEIATNGFCVSKLKRLVSARETLPAMVYQTTAMGEGLPRRRGDKSKQFWGFALHKDGTTSFVLDTSWKIQPRGDEALALPNGGSLTDTTIPSLSSTYTVLADLRQAFDRSRMLKDQSSLRPLDQDGVVAWDTDVFYPNGWAGKCVFRYYDKWRSGFHVRLEGKNSGLWLDASDSENLRYSRNVGGDDRFRSVEDFHGWLRPLIEMMLAYDFDINGIIEMRTPPKWLKGSFDPDHPLLDGVNVPPLQQPLIGAVLGKPYQQALRSISTKMNSIKDGIGKPLSKNRH